VIERVCEVTRLDFTVNVRRKAVLAFNGASKDIELASGLPFEEKRLGL